MVRRMGGSIWVESGEGVGSTFFVELPLASAST
jgi:signal transduction histidine kinase